MCATGKPKKVKKTIGSARLVTLKAGGIAHKVCADCADRIREQAEIAEVSESEIQRMMGFTGRR